MIPLRYGYSDTFLSFSSLIFKFSFNYIDEIIFNDIDENGN